MKFNRSLGLTIVAAALVTAYGCGKEEPKKADTPAAAARTRNARSSVVKIGHAGPTTGPQAHLGKDNENGARLAIDDANAKNIMIDGKKIKFELDAEDDQADPKQGTIVAQKLVDAKVAGVVGHLNSGTTIPASKLYSEAGIPLISPSATNPEVHAAGLQDRVPRHGQRRAAGQRHRQGSRDHARRQEDRHHRRQDRVRRGPRRRNREGRQGRRRNDRRA